MAGHSKWAQIKRQKAVTDAARARVFARYARLIALEAKRSGGSDSPALSTAIARAKQANMPKDNIERAVAKGSSKDSADLTSIVYEAYGPGGAALIIDALTDNKNRTTQEIKHLLSTLGVELATPGAASWAFSKLPGGGFRANDPLADLSEEDGERLGTILSALDEHDDVQALYTNARGYENSEEDAGE